MTDAAPTCPYCGRPARLQDSARIYGTSYGPAWICEGYPACDAFVGCHPGTETPLGTLADYRTRQARKAAHAVFDAIWRRRWLVKRSQDRRYSKAMARGGRYKALAAELGIPVDQCHIGMFDRETCERVIRICQSGALEADIRPPFSEV